MRYLTLTALTASIALLTACTISNTPTPTPEPMASFSLNLNPTALNISTITTGTVNASITPSGGYSQTVTYAATGDAGLNVVQSGSTFSVSSTVPGGHTLTVTATGADGQTKTATASVSVSAVDTTQPTFALSVTPGSLTFVAGGNASVTASAINIGGYTQTVTFSGSGSTGLNVAQNSGTFTVSSSAAGSYTLNIIGTGADGQSKITSVPVTVQAATSGGGGGNDGPAAGIFIPVAGAAVGSGDGTKIGTVYVSPTQQEIDVLNLVNEVRTKGSINGTNIISGTCAEGNWSAKSALTYNGILAYSARKHADYLAYEKYEGHSESNTSSRYFYASTPEDRIAKTNSVTNNQVSIYAYETAGAGHTRPQAIDMVSGWMKSTVHCQIIMNSSLSEFGSGYAKGNWDESIGLYENNWVAMFR